jgi:hypothetical protein
MRCWLLQRRLGRAPAICMFCMNVLTVMHSIKQNSLQILSGRSTCFGWSFCFVPSISNYIYCTSIHVDTVRLSICFKMYMSRPYGSSNSLPLMHKFTALHQIIYQRAPCNTQVAAALIELIVRVTAIRWWTHLCCGRRHCLCQVSAVGLHVHDPACSLIISQNRPSRAVLALDATRFRLNFQLLAPRSEPVATTVQLTGSASVHQ